MVRSIAHQNSSSDMPFQANTGTPDAAIAAAAWSWVEKMLQELQRTVAPSAVRVSISTAVCTVMWRQPAIRAPSSGARGAELRAERHQPRHLGLGDRDLLPPPIGKGDVGDLEVVCGTHAGVPVLSVGLGAAGGAI